MAKTLTSMKLALETLGLRQLDVYRVMESGRQVDLVRVKDMSTGKVVVVNLNTLRESLSIEEFIERVTSELSKAGVRVDERKLAALKSKLAGGK